MSRQYFRPEPSFQGSAPQPSQQEAYSQAYYPPQGQGGQIQSYPYDPQSNMQHDVYAQGQQGFYPSSSSYQPAYDPRMMQVGGQVGQAYADPYALQRPEPSLYTSQPQGVYSMPGQQSYVQPEMRSRGYEQYQTLPSRGDVNASTPMIDFSGSGLDDSSFGFSSQDSFAPEIGKNSNKAGEFLKSLQQGAKNKKMVIGVSLAALSALSLAVLNRNDTQSEINLAEGSEKIPVFSAQNSGPSKVVVQNDKRILGIDSALLNNEGADIDVEGQVIGRPVSSNLQPASAKSNRQFGQSVDLASIDKLAEILPKTEGLGRKLPAPLGVGGSLMMAEAKITPKLSSQEAKDLQPTASNSDVGDAQNADAPVANQQEGVQPFPEAGYIKYIDSKNDPRDALAQARAKNRDMAQLKVEGVYPHDAYVEEDAQRKPADDIVAISQDSNGAIPDFASVPPVAVGRVTSPYGIQLASLPTANAAKAYVETMRTKYPEILGSLASRVQRIKVGDKAFYRVQFGPFNSSATAQEVCSKVGGTCLTIKGGDEANKSPLKAVRG